MTTTTSAHLPARTVLHRALVRVTEGPYRWGTVEFTLGARGGWTRTALTVYPPGTNSSERRRLNAAHAWPVLGALFSIFVLVALDSLPQAASFAGAVVFYLGGFVACAVVTRRLRSRVRHLVVSVVAAGGHVTVYGDAPLQRSLVHGLREIDALAAVGLLLPVEYESRWAELYARLPE